jgi:hypothetical protein
MDSPVYGEALTFKGMMCASYGDAKRKVFVMGSVWWFPSIGLITIGSLRGSNAT